MQQAAAGPVPGTGAFQGYVVAIGASAGGLEALQRLFDALPSDSGAAFVVVQHLSPDHKSLMDNLLARHTRMPVRAAVQSQLLMPDEVVLIPPGTTLRIEQGRLQLAAKAAHGLSLPIDIFFESLASQVGERAVAVVLSGTGSDGSRGVVAVHAQGGRVFVQDPNDARFDGMPRSAMATGLAEQVMPVDALAAALTEALAVPVGEAAAADAALFDAAPLDAVLERLRLAAGIDFRAYKANTVVRRVQRRMQVLGCDTLTDYLTRLDDQPDEADRLRRELLIPVTHFFRDPDAFESLAHAVLRPLAAAGTDEPLRLWVAACATGEEAYTLAMLMTEAFDGVSVRRQVKIFATDVEPRYLEQAGLGLYPAGIEAEVSPERLERFFIARQGGWQVRPEIRQMVIFARHNLVSDPPFTRMHLVSCRNALIYLQPAAQEQVLYRLQYALLPGGHLMLGSSESMGVLQRNFVTVQARHKIFRLQHRDRMALRLEGPYALPYRPQARASTARADEPDATRQALAQAYVPPTLRVNRARELQQVYGDAREWLSLTEGQASLDVVRLLPRELAWAAGLLLRAVFEDGQTHAGDPIRVGDHPERVRLVVRALGEAAAGGPEQALLSFERLPLDDAAGRGPETVVPVDLPKQVDALERELVQTQYALQSTIEELETSNEELQATNEELMASNEELQSTNEELQSVNEELYTVNAEYQQKVEILASLNADLENVAKAAAIPMLFLDEQLTVQRFTPEAVQLFKVREGDVGRPLDDLAYGFDHPGLFEDIRRTLQSRHALEREVRTRDGRWWLLRVQPYVALGSSAPRVVLSGVDVSSLRHLERLQAVLDSLTEHVVVLDRHGTITMVNEAWRAFAAAQGDPGCVGCGTGVNYLAVCLRSAHDCAEASPVHDGVFDVLQGRRPHFRLQYRCDTPERRLWFLMHAAPLQHEGGGAVVSHFDITNWYEGLPGIEARPPAEDR